MRSFVSTLIGGALGLVSLYIVGRVAYQAGREIALAEKHYEEVQKKTIEPKCEEVEAEVETVENPISVPEKKVGFIKGVKNFVGGKNVIGKLIKNPDSHSLEAHVEGNELRVNIKPRSA